ncbi:MAG: Uma2 family endonuclease [Desulfurellaceae bacterium]|nr:Uma2 family endonuclease [Desulfurellaceae bacterium]
MPTKISSTPPAPDERTEPTWEGDLRFPIQAEWSEDDYLKLTDHTRRLLEFRDGHIEVLPMPTDEHQRIVLFLYRTVYAFLATRTDGIVLVAPLRLRLHTGRYREPDLLVLLSSKDKRRGNQFWTGADLVLEVVSPDDPHRDLVRKRQEYAAAGIPEYWIVDPAAERISVLCLQGASYGEHRVFSRGMEATSSLLAGFRVAVTAVLDAE